VVNDIIRSDFSTPFIRWPFLGLLRFPVGFGLISVVLGRKMTQNYEAISGKSIENKIKYAFSIPMATPLCLLPFCPVSIFKSIYLLFICAFS